VGKLTIIKVLSADTNGGKILSARPGNAAKIKSFTPTGKIRTLKRNECKGTDRWKGAQHVSEKKETDFTEGCMVTRRKERSPKKNGCANFTKTPAKNLKKAAGGY